jgi:Carbohydrate-selective porin, OprB family
MKRMKANNWPELLRTMVVGAGLLSLSHVCKVDAQALDTQSSETEFVPFGPSTKVEPAPAELPELGHGSARDFMRNVTGGLDKSYDSYLGFKKDLSDNYNLDFSLEASIYDQFGTPNGGKPVALLVYYPSVTWRPFTDTAFGSGKFSFTFGQQQYWTAANTGTQAGNMGLITFPNDWVSNNYSWSTVAYTHTLPGIMKFLSVTVGQYNLFSFDPNAYAGNAQINFISYPFAQDATQTFPNAGLGAYATVKAPDDRFALSGGFQGATNLSGREITSEGYRTGKYTYWGNFQWKPNFSGLGDGIYSILYYSQPAVPDLPTHSAGISFSASQELGEKWGVFARVSNASGANTPIMTSVAIGGVRNDPFGRNSMDHAGLAFAWNQTNFVGNGVTSVEARHSELVTELYYANTIFKGLQITPDVQVYFHPALAPNTSTAAVFSIRSTFFF